MEKVKPILEGMFSRAIVDNVPPKQIVKEVLTDLRKIVEGCVPKEKRGMEKEHFIDWNACRAKTLSNLKGALE